MNIIFATGNENKVKEIQAMIGDNYDILSLKDVNCLEEIPETANTLIGNAIQKAEYIYKKFGKNCFADDTGLLVESLNGDPGVYSARYAGEQKNSEDNMNLLLQNLSNKTNRKAKFQTAICLIWEGEQHIFTGEVEGEITLEKHGNDGFGYDPIFLPFESKQTFAEMSLSDKNLISHRSRAVKKLADFLISLS
ncbi:non-canonical purine NTP diphosphatase [Parvicella tangerina]|uniref:dITP/XTP pyrophosphatase n=1 Tax=Parvicella tangerina TaxID=2829795 RepID=A0A916NI31_9FLAO|nr:non-canonical purine NTP diphosphatase [Parvicella tangerina]CAG5084323.1 dITP/XTP pyrophosphatase [Parvicella tangerina]